MTQIDLTPFIGRTWASTTADCYTLIRDFYQAAFGLTLTDYARPPLWFAKTPELDLIRTNFQKEGFEPFLGPRAQLRYGDGILMALGSRTITHCAVYLGDGFILHHPFRRLSIRERYTGNWLDRTLIVARNPTIQADRPRPTVSLMDLISPAKRAQLTNGS